MPAGAIVLLAIMLVGAIALAVVVISSDRKRQNRSEESMKWILNQGRNTTCVLVEVDVPTDGTATQQLPASAIAAMGGTDIKVGIQFVEGWLQASSPVGWVFGWAPQQMGVGIECLPSGKVQYRCCSRPRFGTALTDIGRSRKVANELAGEIAALAGQASNEQIQ